MNMRHSLMTTALLAICLSMTACGQSPEIAAKVEDVKAASSAIDSIVKQAADEALAEIAKENITLSGPNGSSLEITAKGELLIDGHALTLTADQQALVIAYRERVSEIAKAGAEIGLQGAALAKTAVTEAVKGALTGTASSIEKHVEAEAATIKASAKKLCDQMPLLIAIQDELIAAVPEFKPYAATIETSSDNNCTIN